jgi:hypothetical protein
MTTTHFQDFIDNAIKSSPIEARIVRRIVKAFREAGDPIVSIFDSEEATKVTTERDILEVVFNLDYCYLETANGSWVMLVMGNEWDVLSDYTTNLELIVAPVMEWIEANQ